MGGHPGHALLIVSLISDNHSQLINELEQDTLHKLLILSLGLKLLLPLSGLFSCQLFLLLGSATIDVGTGRFEGHSSLAPRYSLRRHWHSGRHIG